MQLFYHLGLFIAGLLILVAGAEALIRGAVNLARLLGVSPFIIGLTLVGFGTSAPELVVNVSAALYDAPGLAMGNIVGSNIANIGLILGVAAVLSPLVTQARMLTREMPIMVAVSVLIWILVSDGQLSRIDAGILLAGFAMTTWYYFRIGQEEPEAIQEELSELAPREPSRWGNGILAVLGLMSLIGGAHLMVESATEIARLWQVPEVIIGLTIVAVGTSLPELASTVAAAYRKQADIAVGNVVGSNLFNILMILGVTGMVKPLDVDASLLRVDLPVMLGFAVAMFLMLLRTATIYRLEGIVLLLAYAGFIGWQAIQAS